jgi:hypothetical protein
VNRLPSAAIRSVFGVVFGMIAVSPAAIAVIAIAIPATRIENATSERERNQQ